MARYLSTTKTKVSRTYKLFGTAGTYTFVTPNDVDNLDVAVWGGGGNGTVGGGAYNCFGYGGTGGGFACGNVPTYPGKCWTVTVGAAQGTSSFGTALSATGGTCNCTPGVGCVCSTAGVQLSFTATGGKSDIPCQGPCLYQGKMGGHGSGSPYGTGGAAGRCASCYFGTGGGGWGGNSAAVFGNCGSSGGGGIYSSVGSAGGGSAGPGRNVTLSGFMVSGPCNCVTLWGVCIGYGGAGVNGNAGAPGYASPGVGASPAVNASDNGEEDPFLRIDRLSGGGGAGGVMSAPCFGGTYGCAMFDIPVNGSSGGGGGGTGINICGLPLISAGNGGFGGGGGGGSGYSTCGGNGGFGGGAGAWDGLPGCGGGGQGGQSNNTGGQGAVLVVYDK